MSSRMVTLLAFAAIAVTLLAYLPSLSSYDHFHRDEANWISISQFTFRAFVVDRDFQHQYWSLPLNTFGCYNPHIAKLLIGASLWIHGEGEYGGLVRWNGGRDLEWHIEKGIAPTTHELHAGRLPVVLLTAGTAALLVLLTTMMRRNASGAIGAAIAVAIFLSHPVIREGGRRAMVDVPAAAFSLAALVLAVMARTRLLAGSGAKGLLPGVGAAVCAGLAAGSKLNAGLIVIVLGLIALITFFAKRNRFTFTNLILIALLPLVFFVGHNPFLWNSPFEGIRIMLDFGKIVSERVDKYPDVALTTWSARVAAFYKMLFPLPLLAWLTVASLIPLFRRWRDNLPVILWAVVIPLGVLYWTPLAWERYYIPAVPVIALLIGQGAGSAAFALRRIIPAKES